MRAKKYVTWLAALFFIVQLLMPLVCIYVISNIEMAQYAVQDVPPVREKSYGLPKPVIREDMREFIYVAGTYVSGEKFYMEMPELNGIYSVRLQITAGDYIESGDCIGYTEDGKKELIATQTGVVRDIHLGQYSYITMERIDDLLLRCYVSGDVLTAMRRDTLALTDEAGNAVELVKLNKLENADGSVEVLLRVPGGSYGATEEGL